MLINTIDPAVCPLCGKSNNCRLAQEVPSPEPCWCTRIHISQYVLSLVPEKARNRVCVCQPCVEKYNRPPIALAPLKRSAY